MISLTKKQVKCISPKVAIYTKYYGGKHESIDVEVEVLKLQKVTYWNELINAY